jgi:hypothetical protein
MIRGGFSAESGNENDSESRIVSVLLTSKLDRCSSRNEIATESKGCLSRKSSFGDLKGRLSDAVFAEKICITASDGEMGGGNRWKLCLEPIASDPNHALTVSFHDPIEVAQSLIDFTPQLQSASMQCRTSQKAKTASMHPRLISLLHQAENPPRSGFARQIVYKS